MDGNTARDYSDELYAARKQDSDPVQFHDSQYPDNYRASKYSDNYESNQKKISSSVSAEKTDLRHLIQNKAGEAEKFLPHEIREKLDEVRRDYRDAKKLGGEAKTLVKSLTPWGMFSLLGKVHFLTDIPYFFAILAALLKDGLDLVGIGSLPGIGTAITACDSLFTMAMMFLGNVMHSEHDRTIFQSVLLKQFGVLIFTTIVELIFGIDLAPFQTTGVVFIYAFALAARKGRDNIVGGK